MEKKLYIMLASPFAIPAEQHQSYLDRTTAGFQEQK